MAVAVGKAQPRQLDECDTDSEADISDNEDEAITGQIATPFTRSGRQIRAYVRMDL